MNINAVRLVLVRLYTTNLCMAKQDYFMYMLPCILKHVYTHSYAVVKLYGVGWIGKLHGHAFFGMLCKHLSACLVYINSY